MACTGRYAEAAEFTQFWGYDATLTVAEQASIEQALNITASMIHTARAATGGCALTLDASAAAYCQQINIVLAALFMRSPCGMPQMTDGERGNWTPWATAQLELIRTAKISLYANETGSEYPCAGVIEQSLTDWNTAQIIINAELRTP